MNVTAGEYLLAVNGRDLRDTDNLYSFFEGTAGKSVLLTGRLRTPTAPARARSRSFRCRARRRCGTWPGSKSNRRKVDQMTGGRAGLRLHARHGIGGFTNFNRYFFAQIDKEAAIIDERFNGGGTLADHIIELPEASRC